MTMTKNRNFKNAARLLSKETGLSYIEALNICEKDFKKPIKTPFSELTKTLQRGWQPKSLNIIGAHTGVGKTSFALQ